MALFKAHVDMAAFATRHHDETFRGLLGGAGMSLKYIAMLE